MLGALPAMPSGISFIRAPYPTSLLLSTTIEMNPNFLNVEQWKSESPGGHTPLRQVRQVRLTVTLSLHWNGGGDEEIVGTPLHFHVYFHYYRFCAFFISIFILQLLNEFESMNRIDFI